MCEPFETGGARTSRGTERWHRVQKRLHLLRVGVDAEDAGRNGDRSELQQFAVGATDLSVERSRRAFAYPLWPAKQAPPCLAKELFVCHSLRCSKTCGQALELPRITYPRPVMCLITPFVFAAASDIGYRR